MSSWRGRRVLITSGPTREPLDPIRFLTNASTGRMGWALAAEAKRLGASVCVVTGPCALEPLAGVETVPVVTALEMRREVLERSRAADVVVGAAAVSDWRFARTARHKIKRKPGAVRLTLVPNPDIIKDAARRRRPGQVFVGFALETRRAEAYARKKLREKGLDLIVANGPASLGSDASDWTLIDGEGGAARVRGTKAAAARAILAAAGRRLRP